MQDQTQLSLMLRDELNEKISKGEARERIAEKIKASKWFTRVRAIGTSIELYAINKVVENLSNNLSRGAVDLTIEEIHPKTKEKSGSVIIHLDPQFEPTKLESYVDFIAKYGSFEVDHASFHFNAEMDLEIKNMKVTVEKGRISEVSFDSIDVTISLSFSQNSGSLPIDMGEIKKSIKNAHLARADPNTEFSDVIGEESTEQQAGQTTASKVKSSNQTSQPIEASTKICIKCGAKIQATAKFCEMCGAKQPEADTKSRDDPELVSELRLKRSLMKISAN